MKIASLILGLAASAWAAIGAIFTYLLIAVLLGLASAADASAAASAVVNTTALMWFLIVLFAGMGIIACLVVVLPRLVGALMLLAALLTGLMSFGSVLMLPAVAGYILAAVFAFVGASQQRAEDGSADIATPAGS